MVVVVVVEVGVGVGRGEMEVAHFLFDRPFVMSIFKTVPLGR